MASSHRRPTGLILPPSVPLTRANDPINRGLVGAWMMNEGSGLICRDWSGFSNNGVITHNTQTKTWVPGRSGKAVKFTFDGVSPQAVTIPNTTLAGLKATTLSMWVYQPTTSALEIWASTNLIYYGGSWLFGANAGSPGIIYSPDGSPTSFTFPLNVWFHCVYQFTASTFQLFVNGQPAMSSTATGQVTLGAITQLVIGVYAAGGNAPTTATIQNFRAWGRALSRSEITRLYAQPFAGIVPPPRITARAPASVNYTGTLADTASTSDTYTSSFPAAGTLADTVATSTSFAGALSTVSLSDSAATSDTLTPTFAATGSLSNTAATSDAYQVAILMLGDTVATSDALSVIAAARTLADTAATSDTFALAGSLQTITDTIATSDIYVPSGFTAAGTLAETTTTSDLYTPALAAAGAISDTTATSDAYTPGGASASLLADSLATSDTYSLNASARTLSDTVATSDAYTSVLHLFVSLSDTAGASDAYAVPGNFQQLSDTVLTADLYASSGHFSAAMSDTLSTSDTYGQVLLSIGPILYGRPAYRFAYPTNNPPKV